jgi:hypothetical protein
MADTDGSRLFAWAPTWYERGIALGKALLFYITYSFLFSTAMRTIRPKVDISPAGSIFSFMKLETIQLIFAVLIPVSLLLFVFRESLTVAGLGRGFAGKQFIAGVATGLVLIVTTIGVLYAGGFYVPGPLLLSPVHIAEYAGAYVAVMLMVAVGEESIFRGFGLVQLSRAVGFWPAALLTSIAFGLGHASNGTMTTLGVVSVCSAGLMLAYSFKRTGSLHYAVGFHAAWDGGTTFLFGAVAVGLRLPNTMFHAEIHGPVWITGGGAGPIGGVLGIASFAIAAIVIRLLIGRKQDTGG